MQTTTQAPPRRAPFGIRSPQRAPYANPKLFDACLLALEAVCGSIVDAPPSAKLEPEAFQHWQRINNVITPVSFALNEYRRARRGNALHELTHRKPHEYSPLETLARVAWLAQKRCTDIGDIASPGVNRQRETLDYALGHFLQQHQQMAG